MAVDDGFDLSALKISDVPLGDFPFFSLPQGYRTFNHQQRTYEHQRFPFWTGAGYEYIAGRFHVARIAVDRDRGAKFSSFELERNIAHLVESAGGTQIVQDVIPRESRIGNEERRQLLKSFRHGLCTQNEPVTTYVIRRADRSIWVQTCANGDNSGGWIIAESNPFEATATLLPQSELRQKLDDAGRVAIQVHFATDQAQILPESRPQLDEVAAMLAADEALGLVVEGHTDDTGGAAHNRTLSKARADAVVAELASRGIRTDRLSPAGFGQDRPVADNATPEGKAANRRVELVRRD